MTKYIFVNIPGHGHVNPTLPVVQELVARGGTVIYYLTEEFRSVVEATGATFRPYASLLEQMNAPASVSASDVARNMTNIMPLRMIDEAASVLPLIIDEVRAEQPDCILYDMMSLTGKILARSLHVPAILLRPSYAANEQINVMRQMVVQQQGGSSNSAFSRMPFGPLMAGGIGAPGDTGSAFAGRFAQLDGQLAALCQQYGVEPFRMLEMFSGTEALNIVFIPREFQPHGETFDERYVFVGPSLAPRPATTSFPLETLNGRTVLFISLGTVFNNQAAFFNACFAAFHAEPWLVVLSRGKRVDAAALDPIPANFLVEPYVPQLEVLPRTSVFISHGGMNSTMESFYYGVPLVVIPQMPEQAVTAQRVQDLGLGLMLDSDTLTPESLHLSVERIMQDASFRTHVSEMQAHVKGAGGYKKAADAISSFVVHSL